MHALTEVWFATSNEHKFKEASFVLQGSGVTLRRLPEKGVEIQSDDPGEIAAWAAERSYEKSRIPLFTEDTALYMKGLGGFPGPYASHAYGTLGLEGILRTIHGRDRSAEFVSAVAFASGPGPATLFRGSLKGVIAVAPAGRSGFGYDPIFVPEGSKKTLAEMSLDEKCAVSHRAVALRSLVAFLEAGGVR